MLVTTLPAQLITLWPTLNFSTRNANVICSPSPHATVRQRICLRSVEKRYAAKSTARIPSTPVNRAKRLLLWEDKNARKDFRLPYSIPQIVLSIFLGEDAANQRHR